VLAGGVVLLVAAAEVEATLLTLAANESQSARVKGLLVTNYTADGKGTPSHPPLMLLTF
jgi:hypothetical protein